MFSFRAQSTFIMADLAVPRLIKEERMSGKTVMAVALVLTLGGCFGAQAFGVGGNAGLPPSITQPGWPNSGYSRNSGYGYNSDCYQSRRVHTQNGMRWRRVWVCD